MLSTLPLLEETDFPTIRRTKLETLQVSLGYRCNQQCLHCHVNAGPQRKEVMGREIIGEVIRFLDESDIAGLDLTGGAPELNPDFRYLVEQARTRGVKVMDRCNLTILEEPGHEGLAEFLGEQGVEVVASLPCYLEENVDGQRGSGVFRKSLRALQRLNELGYGRPDSGLVVNLVYNPMGPSLPPPQCNLETDYKRELANRYGVTFNRLLTLTNMPIQRFGSTLVSKGRFNEYVGLLKSAFQEINLARLMCRSMISVDWRGYVYDCDFNQVLGLPICLNGRSRLHLSKLAEKDLDGQPIIVADHCYGCTAGHGSSCGGALS